MTFIRFELPEGFRTFSSEQGDFDMEPLDHAALAALVNRSSAAHPITLRNVREADDRGVPIPEAPLLSATFQVTLRGEMKSCGLMPGGRAPALIGNGRVAFLDENMVYRRRKRSGRPSI